MIRRIKRNIKHGIAPRIKRYKQTLLEYKEKVVLACLAGALLSGGTWQLEVVKIRALHNQPYSLPFYLASDVNYIQWAVVWLAVIAGSYILLFLSTQVSWAAWKISPKRMHLLVLSLLLFPISVWQLGLNSISQIRNEPYQVPFSSIETVQPMELTGNTMFNPVFESSFWGDFWMFFTVLSYVLLFVRIL